jgi:hypothetical protein
MNDLLDQTREAPVMDLLAWAGLDPAPIAEAAADARRRARNGDPATSHAAARAADRIAADHFAKILRALRQWGPGTIYDIAEHTRLSHVQVARRLPEMRDKGWGVGPTNVTAEGPTGRQCRVWGAGQARIS